MHNKLFIFIIAVIAFAACNRSPRDISDLKDATPADSMMFYFGEMNASNYWQDAHSDTLLQTEQAREEFMEGFRKALELDRDQSAYNKGLQLGLRLALRLREFNERYGEDFSEAVLASSMAAFLKDESAINILEAQRGYYNIKDQFELNAAQKELGDSKLTLAHKGKENNYNMVNDTLYAQDVTPPTSGPTFKEGDRIAVEVSACTLDGKEIVARQFPDSITLGEGRIPPIVRQAIYTMTDGQTRRFMTTPRTLFGKRYAAYHLPYDEPVIFTVKAYR